MKKCDHFIFGKHGGTNMLCRLEWLARVVASNAEQAFVGLGPTPRDITMKELKYFTDWTKYCPKCGEKMDYGPIIEELCQ